METTFYRIGDVKCNAEFSPIADFDHWACTFYDEIVGVKREVWDVFARWKFINTLIDNGVLELSLESYEVEPVFLLMRVKVEEKSSDAMVDQSA